MILHFFYKFITNAFPSQAMILKKHGLDKNGFFEVHPLSIVKGSQKKGFP